MIRWSTNIRGIGRLVVAATFLTVAIPAFVPQEAQAASRFTKPKSRQKIRNLLTKYGVGAFKAIYPLFNHWIPRFHNLSLMNAISPSEGFNFRPMIEAISIWRPLKWLRSIVAEHFPHGGVEHWQALISGGQMSSPMGSDDPHTKHGFAGNSDPNTAQAKNAANERKRVDHRNAENSSSPDQTAAKDNTAYSRPAPVLKREPAGAGFARRIGTAISNAFGSTLAGLRGQPPLVPLDAFRLSKPAKRFLAAVKQATNKDLAAPRFMADLLL